jgi:hypothetical protein
MRIVQPNTIHLLLELQRAHERVLPDDLALLNWRVLPALLPANTTGLVLVQRAFRLGIDSHRITIVHMNHVMTAAHAHALVNCRRGPRQVPLSQVICRDRDVN